MHLFTSFKGFRDARLDLSPSLVLLIGRNGSGKSNAIEAVQLLAALANGTSFRDIGDEGTPSGLSLRGGLAGCVGPDRRTIQLGFESGSTSYELRIDGASSEVEWECFRMAGMPSYEAVRSNLGRMTITSGGRSYEVEVDGAALSRFRIAESRHEALVGLRIPELPTPTVISAMPSFMRRYVPAGQRWLTTSGSNLSSVLATLRAKQPVAFARVVGAIREIPEEPVESLDFEFTEQGDVRLELKLSGDGRRFGAHLLSDGTLRALAALTAVEVERPGDLLVLEEIDNGIHPSRVARLLSHVAGVAAERELHLLCTTHNPALLDGLSPDQLDAVVLCHRDEDGASKLTRLSDLPALDVLLADGRLGDLVTRGVLDRYVLPRATEERKEAVLTWLDRLGGSP